MSAPTPTTEGVEPPWLARLREELASAARAADGAPRCIGSGALDASFRERFPLTILVVEDNKLNLKVAQGLLARLGYAPDTATNGVEAIQATARESYDVVLMDVQMPVMDGLAATRQIRARLGEAAPRVIAMTGAESPDEHRQCVAVGMDGLVAKPVRIEALAEALAGARPRATGAGVGLDVLDLGVLGDRLRQVGESGARAELAMVLGRAEAAIGRILHAVESGNAGGAIHACVALGEGAARLGAGALAARVAALGRLAAQGVSSAERASAADTATAAAREVQALATLALATPSDATESA